MQRWLVEPSKAPAKPTWPCWQEPDQRGEDRTVSPVKPRPRMGTAQHSDLVPQHEQFGIPGGR